MEIKQCAFGHFYDAGKHGRCPYCGGRDDRASEPRVIRREAIESAPPAAEERETSPAKTEARPVVGWLVCVAGPGVGRSYEIRSENNYLGRGNLMDIDIKNDFGISRDRPVAVAYDIRTRAFFCGITNGREVVRLNGRPLLSTTELHAGDKIELSQTELMFVPLCGSDFDWDWDNLPR